MRSQCGHARRRESIRRLDWNDEGKQGSEYQRAGKTNGPADRTRRLLTCRVRRRTRIIPNGEMTGLRIARGALTGRQFVMGVTEGQRDLHRQSEQCKPCKSRALPQRPHERPRDQALHHNALDSCLVNARHAAKLEILQHQWRSRRTWSLRFRLEFKRHPTLRRRRFLR